MKKLSLFQGWTVMRFVRLALGLVIFGQGIFSKDYFFMAIGGWFTVMPLLNIGCCGISNSCSVPSTKSDKSEEVSFEEVRTK